MDPDRQGVSGLAGLNVAPFPDRVVEMISDLIATGEIRGGDRLAEKALADLLGVSRTPLREAIKILTARGLAKSRPNAGAVVSLPDEREAAELVQVMGWLWEKMAPLVCQNMTGEQLAGIEALHLEMCALDRQEQMLDWAKLNRRFHESIIAASDNEVLCEIALNLQMRIYLCFAIGQRTVERQAQSNREHGEIVEVLTARDSARLAGVLMGHTNRAFDTAYETGILKQESGTESDANADKGATKPQT
ncbi:GntR family transcriptional regulator [Roseovarius atlanticus]|uniref:GntR family transcriptional regulator n=1 Tax=Roseovarius atlanticus TaxID=1641875 RepID=UPI001C9430D8|nr:GntR family transcriptional regulator [Roseovarius atlanticus]MBY5986442.1 GntR family transcriptional regulator [Roseovarius atlanticus]MBY6125082.1 GntR family transcriptional regulator [Roseovarius atlanticus]MBY6150457.1 GntR family transcriptional regulator [Roseovarius atlanticus]